MGVHPEPTKASGPTVQQVYFTAYEKWVHLVEEEMEKIECALRTLLGSKGEATHIGDPERPIGVAEQHEQHLSSLYARVCDARLRLDTLVTRPAMSEAEAIGGFGTRTNPLRPILGPRGSYLGQTRR